MGNAISSCSPLSCQLATISPVPASPCFSHCCFCPSWLLVSVMLPPANLFITLILFNPFLPAPAPPSRLVPPSRHRWSHRVSAPGQVPASRGAGWCRCHLERRACSRVGVRGCGCCAGGTGALALLHQSLAIASLAPRAETLIGAGSAVVGARGGRGHLAGLHRALWPARVESRHFLHSYLFWESSKISGSQF